MEEKKVLDVKKISVEQILKANYNKASLFSEEDQDKIAKLVIKTYDTDKKSRVDRETRWKDIQNILTENKIVQKGENRRANIIYPLIKQACKKWATEAYPILFQNGEVVKAKIIGRDEGEEAIDPISEQPLTDDEQGGKVWKIAPGQKIDKANRRVDFDNYIFMKKVENFEKSMDELLFRLPMFGSFFKKVYFSEEKETIKSDILFPQSVIVNNYAVDNEYTVYSQELQLDVNTIKAKQLTNIFLDIELIKEFTEESKTPTDNNESTTEHSNYTETPQLFIEQYRWLDLDGDGFQEPYIVVVHKDSEKLVGIYARYTSDDITKQSGKIIYIKSKEYFVKYGFIPTNDGSFYDEGFGDLLFHANNVVDTLINQLVDAGTLANGSQGFISKALKQRPGNIKVKPGEWEYIDMFGINIRETILPIDHKEPSLVLFQLMQFILESSKELIGTNPIFSQNLNPNIAPTTMMALVEEGSKEFKALYKRIYRSLNKEIELVENIIRENRDYFEPLYTEILDDEKANFDEDYDNKTYDIIPVSDVEVTTSFEKSQKSMFLLQLLGNQVLLPFLDIELILRNVLIAVNCKDISNIIKTPPPAQPDPMVLALEREHELKLEEIKSERMRIELATIEAKRKLAEGAIKAQESDYKNKEMEVKIEQIIAQTIKTYEEAKKVKSETDLLGKSDLSQTRQEVDNLYEPKKVENEGRNTNQSGVSSMETE